METQFTIAHRCDECGKIEFYHLSLFQLSGKKPLQLNCSCGHKGINITTRNYKTYWISIPCAVCTTQHIYQISLREILKGEPVILSCHDYDLELCFLGEKNRVEKIVDEYEQDLEDIIDDLGYDDYFENGEIMMECLNLLHDLAEEQGLTCECGMSDVDVNLLPDKIELKCNNCRNTYMVSANTRKDVEDLKNRESIYIGKNPFSRWESYPMDPN
ncbi:hypothetical protein NSA47_10695 [Irregularibacter muris]|uniref:Uncharacterized protein n=1 Tax=Irregularibacter muris TaxID=1796619 RepID=A0AAE3HH53_9FIRM|nr:hypothetical protein [Irregularibacter muris]MCR1899452.1 hypothetical protein [Irregularibacter muris]